MQTPRFIKYKPELPDSRFLLRNEVLSDLAVAHFRPQTKRPTDVPEPTDPADVHKVASRILKEIESEEGL